MPAPQPRLAMLSPLLRACVAFALGFFTLVLHAQTTGGVIEGRVFNAATGRALADAHVRIDGTKIEAVTDQFGAYRIPSVPAGEARVSVSYVGLATQAATVVVGAGAVAARDFELPLASRKTGEEVLQLSAFTVVA